MIDVSIIIINYFTCKMTCEAVRSVINESSGFSFEIIVVDNSNNNSEYDFLSKNLPKSVILLNPLKNLGFGGGNNYGSSYSKGEYLLFLNSDTLLINNAINEMLFFIKKNNPCVVGCNLFTKDYEPNHSFYYHERNAKSIKREYSFLTAIRKKISKRRDDFNYSNTPMEINGYICGACLMVPSSSFRIIGGFDKEIFMYAEDNLLCFLLKKELKLKMFNIPSAKILHYEGGSFSSDSKRMERIIDGNYHYFIKAYGYSEFLMYLKVMKKAFFTRFFLASVLFKKKIAKQYKLAYLSYDRKLTDIKNHEQSKIYE